MVTLMGLLVRKIESTKRDSTLYRDRIRTVLINVHGFFFGQPQCFIELLVADCENIRAGRDKQFNSIRYVGKWIGIAWSQGLQFYLCA